MIRGIEKSICKHQRTLKGIITVFSIRRISGGCTLFLL